MNTSDDAPRSAPVPPRNPSAVRPAVVPVSLLCALGIAGGCAAVPPVDIRRMAYETLRREDCRLNQLDQFCQRNFANEYAEYERLRRHFIRDTVETREPPPATGDDR